VSDASLDHDLRCLMLAMAELRPGIVCMDTICPEASWRRVPHMANDSANHPHPYGMISTATYEWRRKPWWRRGK
jgi:hypothetical protein